MYMQLYMLPTVKATVLSSLFAPSGFTASDISAVGFDIAVLVTIYYIWCLLSNNHCHNKIRTFCQTIPPHDGLPIVRRFAAYSLRMLPSDAGAARTRIFYLAIIFPERTLPSERRCVRMYTPLPSGAETRRPERSKYCVLTTDAPDALTPAMPEVSST